MQVSKERSIVLFILLMSTAPLHYSDLCSAIVRKFLHGATVIFTLPS